MIDHNGAVPMYQQLASSLEAKIKNGEYLDGHKLPSESQLCKETGVSRVTVRQALSILEQKDLAYSVHGKGTFVRFPSIKQGLLKITSFEKTLQQKGLTGYTSISNYQRESAPYKALSIFEDIQGEVTVSLTLIGYANDNPIVYYKSFFPKAIGEKVHELALNNTKEKKAFSTFDLLGQIEQENLEIHQTLTAVNGCEEICTLLNTPLNTAFLTMETFVYSNTGRLLEFKTAYYRPDKYSFTIKRQLG